MGVEFDWLTPEKTIMGYITLPPWNWKDYYRAVKIAGFKMHNLGHQVDVILDLTNSPTMPAGAVAHLRGVGKPTHESLSGIAVIVGCPKDIEENLTGGQGRTMQAANYTIHFTDQIEDAINLLNEQRTPHQK